MSLKAETASTARPHAGSCASGGTTLTAKPCARLIHRHHHRDRGHSVPCVCAFPRAPSEPPAQRRRGSRTLLPSAEALPCCCRRAAIIVLPCGLVKGLIFSCAADSLNGACLAALPRAGEPTLPVWPPPSRKGASASCSSPSAPAADAPALLCAPPRCLPPARARRKSRQAAACVSLASPRLLHAAGCANQQLQGELTCVAG